jgi:hypothetical protein
MRNPASLPEEFERLDDCVHALREHIRKGAHANEIGRSVASLYLDSIARIRAYMDQLDELLGYQVCLPDLTLEENLPRTNTALRILGRLNDMFLEQIDGFLKCLGGTQTIAVERLVEWAKEDPSREQLMVQAVATSIALGKQLRQKK